MIISCLRQDLMNALNIASKAVSTRSTIPAMKGILIDASEDGNVLIASSDSDISIQHKIEAEVSEPGIVVLPAKLFIDIVRSTPEAQITISTDANLHAELKSMNSDFKIVGMDAEDFPRFETPDDHAQHIQIPALLFKNMIAQTSFAASTDDSRGIITGVLIDIHDQEMHLAALDGYRLAVANHSVAEVNPYSIVISAKLLNDLSKIISDVSGIKEDTMLNIELESKKAVFRFPDLMIELKLLNGQFVDYKNIIPKNSTIQVKADRNALIQSIERASLLARDDKNKLIRMDIQDQIMSINARAEEGTVHEDLVISKTGDDLEIGFNAQYLLDMLKSIRDDEIFMNFKSSIDPCIVTPLQGNAYEYLVLPVRL
jgi:DNA polymerase-3 subunit beta